MLAAIPLGVDLVFECCGRQEALDEGLRLLKPGGTLLVVGIPETQRVSFDIDLLRRKEIRVQNVRRQNGCTEKTLDWIRTGELDATPLVTHHFPFARCGEAMELVDVYRDGVVKAMLTFLT